MMYLKSILLFLFFLIQVFPSFSQNEPKPNPKAEQLLKEAVENSQVMGIAAGFSFDGKTLWKSSAGYFDLAQNQEANSDMLMRTASIVKPMTGIAILQLVEKNQLDLDKPIQTYLPDFPKKPEGDITTRQLLNHSSGIGWYKSSKELNNKKNYPSLNEAVNIFKERELVATPGTTFLYSSYAYVVLGLIIERVSGLSYEAYMKKNIWEKCGMTHTGVEKYGTKYPNQALLYNRNDKGKIKATKPTNLSDRIPGGGCYTNVDDLLKFGQAIMEHKLIKESSLKLMLQDAGLKKEGNGYGLAWYLYGNNPKYGPVFGHTGAQMGASGQLMILPEIKTTIVVLSNTSGALETVSGMAVKLFDIAADAQE